MAELFGRRGFFFRGIFDDDLFYDSEEGEFDDYFEDLPPRRQRPAPAPRARAPKAPPRTDPWPLADERRWLEQLPRPFLGAVEPTAANILLPPKARAWTASHAYAGCGPSHLLSATACAAAAGGEGGQRPLLVPPRVLLAGDLLRGTAAGHQDGRPQGGGNEAVLTRSISRETPPPFFGSCSPNPRCCWRS